MEPACSIIKLLGGESVVSEITGTSYTAPYRWQHPKERGGTGGIIPQRHHLKLLAFAKEKKIRLRAESFLPVNECDQARAA